jgi:hypothetical protein
MNALTSLSGSNTGQLPNTMLQETYDVQQKDFYELSTARPTGTSLESRLQEAFVRDAQKEAGHAEAMRTMVSRFEIQSNPYLHLLSVTARHSVEIQVKSALAKKFTNIFDTLLK